MVSVYLANQNILAVEGGRNGQRLSHVCVGRLPDGCLRNGVVVNDIAFLDGLKSFWNENRLPKKDVRLVLGGNRAVLRTITVPVAKEKQTRTMVRQEMSDVSGSDGEGGIVDYMTLANYPGEKTQRLLCAVMDRTVLKSMQDQFELAEIKLEMVTTDQLSILSLLVQMKEMTSQTCAVLLMDADNVRVLLLDKGHYKYVGTSRAFGLPGSTEYADEVVQVLNSVKQFQSTDKNADPLTSVYYAHMEPENVAPCTAAIEAAGFACAPLPELPRVKMSGEKPPFLSKWAYAIGALMSPAKRHLVNFLQDESKKDAADKKRNSGLLKALPYVAVLLVGSGVFGTVLADNMRTQDQINANYAYLEADDIVAALAEYDRLDKHNTTLQQSIETIDSFRGAVVTYPMLTGKVLDRIRACGGNAISVQLTGFTGSSGEVKFDAYSADVIDIPAYIRGLEGTGLFRKVSYSGYGYKAADAAYTINVSCFLKAGVGREGQQ